MAIAAVNPRRTPGTWPMTAQARAQLVTDADRLAGVVIETNGYVSGHLGGEADAPSFVPNIAGQQARRQLETIRAVLESAQVLDDPDLAIIGRAVSLRGPDGTTARYELVIPGDGNAAAGLISADSPVGSAVLGRRVGDEVLVAAPAGSWTATLVEVS
jgi:Transcription elongation factor, GreA/GreB, C-term